MKALLVSLFTATAATGIAVSPAFAAEQATLNNLPKDGMQVELTGNVESVSDSETFTLEDNAGNDIDVNLSTPVTLQEGQQVTITGEVDKGFLGGAEIEQATVIAMNDTGVTTQTNTTIENNSSMDSEQAPSMDSNPMMDNAPAMDNNILEEQSTTPSAQ